MANNEKKWLNYSTIFCFQNKENKNKIIDMWGHCPHESQKQESESNI